MVERLIITDEAKVLWDQIKSDPILTEIQKKKLSWIIQNPGVSIIGEDIEEWGDGILELQKQSQTKKNLSHLSSIFNMIIDYLDSCIVDIEEAGTVKAVVFPFNENDLPF